MTEQLPLTPVELALAALLLVLERRVPGVADDLIEALESDALHSEVRRLHGPTPDPSISHSLREALGIGIKARFLVKAHSAPVKRKKGRS